MSDLETLLAPLVDSAPEPVPLAAVSARASGIRRRRRLRTTAGAVVVIGVVAAIAAVGFLERARRPASNREDS